MLQGMCQRQRRSHGMKVTFTSLLLTGKSELDYAQAFPMSVPTLKPREYRADLWLCYRGIKYRPAALQLFVRQGGWGREYLVPHGISGHARNGCF